MENIVFYWNARAMELFDTHQNPGDDSRRMALLHIAMHNTLNNMNLKYELYDKTNNTVNSPSPIDTDAPLVIVAAVTEAANFVLEWALNNRYPTIDDGSGPVPDNSRGQFELTDKTTRVDKLKGWYDTKSADYLNISGNSNLSNAIMVGRESAQKIIQRTNNDKIDEVIYAENTTYVEPTEKFKFCSDYYHNPYFTPILIKNWAEKVNSFCTTSKTQFGLDGPLEWSGVNQGEGALYQEDLEYVKKYGVKEEYQTGSVKFELKPWKPKIHYWLDNRFHVVWNHFTLQVIKDKDPSKSLDEWDHARILALVHTAMADGAISMLYYIYQFYYWRPVSAMKHYGIKMGTGNNAVDWQPLISDQPRVPEYPSGFGVIGACAGEVLINVFGDDVNVVLHSKIFNPNGSNTIKYKKISEAVHDNAFTKVYCGWQFRKSVHEGMALGKKISKYVHDNFFKKSTKISDWVTPTDKPGKVIKDRPYIRG